MEDVGKSDFARSLTRSKADAGREWWAVIYGALFPESTAIDFNKDEALQRRGVDRVVSIGSRIVRIEEKVRDREFEDVALEYWSNRGRKVRGWIARNDMLCDYFAYVMLPYRKCLFFAWPRLRAAWVAHHKEWVAAFPLIEARNPNYTTVSVGVPLPVLEEAGAKAITVDLLSGEATLSSGRPAFSADAALSIIAGRQFEFITGKSIEIRP